MATIITSGSQSASFTEGPIPALGPHDAAFAPPYGMAGPGDGVEPRTHQLSALVEFGVALAGALDVESALGTILAPTRTYYIKRVGRSHVARAVSYRGNIEIDIGAK